MTAFVICRDRNVDEFGRGVSVTEGDDGDVDVGCFFDGLSVCAGVGDDDEAWLFEGAGDVVCEVTGSETAGDGDGTGVCGELEHGALAVGSS